MKDEQALKETKFLTEMFLTRLAKHLDIECKTLSSIDSTCLKIYLASAIASTIFNPTIILKYVNSSVGVEEILKTKDPLANVALRAKVIPLLEKAKEETLKLMAVYAASKKKIERLLIGLAGISALFFLTSLNFGMHVMLWPMPIKAIIISLLALLVIALAYEAFTIHAIRVVCTMPKR